jgi:hypothetical protein
MMVPTTSLMMVLVATSVEILAALVVTLAASVVTLAVLAATLASTLTPMTRLRRGRYSRSGVVCDLRRSFLAAPYNKSAFSARFARLYPRGCTLTVSGLV